MPFRRHSDPFRGGLQVSGCVELGLETISPPSYQFFDVDWIDFGRPLGPLIRFPISNPIPPPVAADGTAGRVFQPNRTTKQANVQEVNS